MNCFIIASAYVGARAMFYGQVYGTKENGNATTSYGAVSNPAIALGLCLSGFLNEGWDSWKAIYIYPTVPFGGAILAVIFFELIWKKAVMTLQHDAAAGDMGEIEEEEEDHGF